MLRSMPDRACSTLKAESVSRRALPLRRSTCARTSASMTTPSGLKMVPSIGVLMVMSGNAYVVTEGLGRTPVDLYRL
jgi:hypothetical protein